MKVLVTLDGSKFAEAVLGPAANLAGTSNAEVHLIEVVKPAPAVETRRGGRSAGRPAGTEAPAAVPQRTLPEAEEYLNDVASRFFPRGATRKAILGENPVEEIAGYASRENVDLIAIATHGRTGLARLTMGSVAGELLKARVAPLFMVRPEGLFYATTT